jgi:hypothetical protein
MVRAGILPLRSTSVSNAIALAGGCSPALALYTRKAND